MEAGPNTPEAFRRRIAELESRLQESEETLEAIRTGEVDAIVVSDVKKGQQVYTLESADKPYRILVEQMQEGAVTLDAEGNVLYCNRRFAAMLHEAMERVTGAPIQRFIAKSESAAFEQLLADSGRGGARGEFRLQAADGSVVPAQLSFIDLPGGSDAGRVLCGVLTDLTEPLKLEKQLRQALKMDTIGQLTGSIAHDFNNLLMAVISNLDLLGRRLSDEPQNLKLVHGAMEGARRGASLTQRLLAYARRQDLRTDSVDLAGLLRGMNDLLEQSAGPLVEMRIEVQEGLPPARVDINQLELALLNLTLNASDAMPDGGKLTIILDQVAVSAGAQDALAPGAYLRIRISDTGRGMDEKTLGIATEPFFTTKEIGKGTGLGLPMVHGLAKQLGGALCLSSVVGQGTTAELWLPVASTPVSAIRPMPIENHEIAPATILLVDDDVLIAMSTAEMLRDLGHTVLEESSGARALEVLGSDIVIDILITDQAMPVMTGIQLISAARKLRPTLPALLATGYSDLPQGAADDVPRLGKPYSRDDLARAIARLLRPI